MKEKSKEYIEAILKSMDEQIPRQQKLMPKATAQDVLDLMKVFRTALLAIKEEEAK